jgi:hypothetical protein
MSALTITLPEDLQRMAHTRASSIGYKTVADYVGALILADAGEPISAELEEHLLKALKTPSIEVTPAYWQEQKRKLAALHGREHI